MQNKVILTGYRATGKSSVGKKLAFRLNVDFFDIDKVIEEQQGASIRTLVAKYGWSFFRKKEKQLLTELVTKNNVVIATGGGAILHQDVWHKLIKTGLCVWLTADWQTICQRLTTDLSSKESRPSLTGREIQQETQSMLAERQSLYRQGSHLTIDTSINTIDDIVTMIVGCLEKLEFLFKIEAQ